MTTKIDLFKLSSGTFSKNTVVFTSDMFKGIKRISEAAMSNFCKTGGFGSVNLWNSPVTAPSYSGTVTFPDLEYIDENGLLGGFRYTNITSVSFPKLTAMDSYALSYAFYGCTNLTSASFPKLTDVRGFNYTFYNTKISTLSFPSLSKDSASFSWALNGMSKLTTLHLPNAFKTISGFSRDDIMSNNSGLPSSFNVLYDL